MGLKLLISKLLAKCICKATLATSWNTSHKNYRNELVWFVRALLQLIDELRHCILKRGGIWFGLYQSIYLRELLQRHKWLAF